MTTIASTKLGYMHAESLVCKAEPDYYQMGKILMIDYNNYLIVIVKTGMGISLPAVSVSPAQISEVDTTVMFTVT